MLEKHQQLSALLAHRNIATFYIWKDSLVPAFLRNDEKSTPLNSRYFSINKIGHNILIDFIIYTTMFINNEQWPRKLFC